MSACGVGYLTRKSDHEVNRWVVRILSPLADRLYVKTRLKESGIKTVMFSNITARESFQCAILDLET
jgi:phosphoribosylaminoimidazole carboxylase (NCAIR synthetase)